MKPKVNPATKEPLQKSNPLLDLHQVSLAYQDQLVVEQISCQLEKGQLGCLLGPSGCGKTTVLKAISGFEPIVHGEIIIRQRVVSTVKNCLPPEQRDIGMVFQDYALFPHLTVAENVAFGLFKWPTKKRQARVAKLLELVSLTKVAACYPEQLSGGQQQRVALIRALAPKPDLLLLDEPFASLDEHLRFELGHEIRHLLTLEGITGLMVTHDQYEAFDLADVVGVMHAGQLHQWASPYDLYHEPATRFVANFIGRAVFLSAKIIAPGKIKTCLGIFDLSTARVSFHAARQKTGIYKTSLEDLYQLPTGASLELLVRPDDVIHDDQSNFTAKVVAKAFRGAHILYTLAVNNSEQVFCLAPSHHDHGLGEAFGIHLELDHLVLFA